MDISFSNNSLNIHSRNEFVFRWACADGHLNVAQWLYNISYEKANDKINIRINNDFPFRCACNADHKDIAEWLCTINKDYKIIYNNGKMIPYIQDLKKILAEKNIDEVSKCLDGMINKNDCDMCMICLSNDDDYWVKLECCHQLCSTCFIEIDRCPYRCANYIDLQNVKVYHIYN
jgi:hypothetical protein